MVKTTGLRQNIKAIIHITRRRINFPKNLRKKSIQIENT